MPPRLFHWGLQLLPKQGMLMFKKLLSKLGKSPFSSTLFWNHLRFNTSVFVVMLQFNSDT